MIEAYGEAGWIPQSGTISVAIGTAQFSSETIDFLLNISEIEAEEKTIRFRRPLSFIVKYDEYGFFNVDDDLISIHESDADFNRLVNKVREDLEIQWEDIVMADDKDLYDDAVKLKRHLLSLKESAAPR
ncbi:hypothetical protein [Thermoplasma sp. Kam2015]|uniref:hypothetical protein n=1 Tax=Thermoplasma sp. Kam2015 TaxID=2094122 RepID=UPI0012932D27|nr:hypothetical protein [Thermoplasma sp. Kam2015]